jgi:hypothetical protein
MLNFGRDNIVNAIREIIETSDEKITVSLPSNYRNKKLEVIVREYNENKNKTDRKLSFGCLKGKLTISDDFDTSINDFKDYME